MSKALSVVIRIPQPCSQPWAEMTVAKDGRHCSRCRKVVVDFTAMTDAQLLEYVRTHGSGCGCFRTDQLDRPILGAQASRPKFFSRIAAAVLLLFATYQSTEAQNRKGSDTQQTSSPEKLPKSQTRPKTATTSVERAYVEPIAEPKQFDLGVYRRDCVPVSNLQRTIKNGQRYASDTSQPTPVPVPKVKLRASFLGRLKNWL